MASADTNLTLVLTEREIDIIRGALRTIEEGHKRNGFSVLVIETSTLRGKFADALIDHSKQNLASV